MADNTTLNSGSGGDLIGSDDISGVKYQRVKLIFGADGVNSGDVSAANPLPVLLAAETTKVIGTVNIAAAQTVATVTTVGTVTTITNVVHVDDNSGSLTVDNAGTFAVQATLAAGAAAIAKAEDVASANADVGVPAMAVQKATPANTAGTDGDYEFLQMSAGRLWASATIDAALPAGTNAIGKLAANTGVTIGAVEIAAAQTLATVTTVSTVTNVATIGTSVTPGTSAAHLGKAEDAAHSSGDTGVMVLAVRNDAGTALAGTTGDYIPLSTDSSGALRVVGSSGTTQYAEDAASAGGESLCLSGAVRQDTLSSSTSADGDYAYLKVSSTGALYVNVAEGGVTGVVEDAAAAGGETGVMVLAVRQDSISSSVSTDGDFGTLKINSVGRLYTSATIDAALPAGSNTIGALTANQSVNVAQINGVTTLMGNGASGTGAQRVTIANDSTGILAAVTSLTQMNGQAISMGTGARAAGTQRVTIATDDVVPASQSGTWTVQPGNTANTTAWLVNDQPAASGGLSLAGGIMPATPAKTVAKGSAGQVYAITAYNILATPVYLKVWNNVTGSVTLGTTACDYQFIIPGNTAGAGFVINVDKGIAMGTGIIFAVTNLISTTDNTAITANSVIVNMGYK